MVKSIEKHYNDAVAIDEEQLKALFKLASEYVNADPEITVRYDNGATAKSNSCEGVIDEEAELHYINYISILGMTKYGIDPKRTIYVSLKNEFFVDVRVSISGDGSEVTEQLKKTDAFFSRNTLWYGLVTRRVFGIRFINISAFTLAVLTSNFVGVYIKSLYLIILCSFLTYLFMYFVMPKFFPPLVFKIGVSKKRIFNQNTASIAMTAVVVPVVVGLITNWLWKIMGN